MCSGTSRGSRRSAGTNAIIEQAAKLQLRNDKKAMMELVEQSKAQTISVKPLS